MKWVVGSDAPQARQARLLNNVIRLVGTLDALTSHFTPTDTELLPAV
jgi:hypothetical protein